MFENFPLREAIRPGCFKDATRNFKAYFVGKVLAAVSSQFKHLDFVGGSLIPTSVKDDETSFQLFDLVSRGDLPTGLMSTTSIGRCRWGAWAYAHFNAERGRAGLSQLPADKCEHSGCEFVRYCRECLQQGWADYIPSRTLSRLQELGHCGGRSAGGPTALAKRHKSERRWLRLGTPRSAHATMSTAMAAREGRLLCPEFARQVEAGYIVRDESCQSNWRCLLCLRNGAGIDAMLPHTGSAKHLTESCLLRRASL